MNTAGIKIWKPGVDLRSLLAISGDTTTYGGLSEIRYFVDHFQAMTITSINELRHGDVLILNNSNPSFNHEVLELKNKHISIFQMVSDLNLEYSEDLIGPHIKLTQIPTTNTPKTIYAALEQAAVLYQEPNYNVPKEYKLVYGGGKRAGNRDVEYDRYLDLEAEYLSLIVSSSPKFPKDHPKVSDRLSFNQLQELYSKARYGLVISDPSYYDAGMLTQRYWEYCLNDMVAFMDVKYDKYNYLSQSDDFRRVSDPDELAQKIQQLEENDQLRVEIIVSQRNEVGRARQFMLIENKSLLSKILVA